MAWTGMDCKNCTIIHWVVHYLELSISTQFSVSIVCTRKCPIDHFCNSHGLLFSVLDATGILNMIYISAQCNSVPMLVTCVCVCSLQCGVFDGFGVYVGYTYSQSQAVILQVLNVGGRVVWERGVGDELLATKWLSIHAFSNTNIVITWIDWDCLVVVFLVFSPV